ncbi:MAG: peptidoglycan DD-metalloendopeptidase family protein [Alphaproteobacteria bacterium]|nr:peptidoglycan DD-metalloendopeptidase family protein [Alphaproteobacteria bacterium]
MTTGIVAGVRDFVYKAFPQRQIYHRSNGVVHFTELGPWTQFAMTLLTLTFLGWVAYASVNVVFKDQIIAAKDARFRSMQQAYEGRISKMQLAYEELNGLLALAEDRFRATTDDLEGRQRQIEALLSRLNTIEKSQAALEERARVLEGKEYLLPNLTEQQVASVTAARDEAATPVIQVDRDSYMSASVAALPGGKGQSDPLQRYLQTSHMARQAQQFALLRDRQVGIYDRQLEQMTRLSQKAEAQIREFEGIIRLTGLDADAVAGPRQMAELQPVDTAQQGGPLLSLFGETIDPSDGGDDPIFQNQLMILSNQYDRLSSLEDALTTMPIVLPMPYAERLSSGFGTRVDPFTRRLAHHGGLDFAASTGDPVIATSSGVVVWAERRGPYGNMVEIDHGGGFKTRYAHLSAINVTLGQQVEPGTVVGKVGSTGRSTGPHLHYEVWYDGKPRDPKNFLRAGRYVFEK